MTKRRTTNIPEIWDIEVQGHYTFGKGVLVVSDEKRRILIHMDDHELASMIRQLQVIRRKWIEDSEQRLANIAEALAE